MTDNNPKKARALLDGKAPLEYVPGGSLEGAARVLKHGADKYGKFNWRIEKIADSTYVGAFRRHLEAWIDGEDIDPDSGEHHLDHVMANCIIIRDAIKHGTLISDRNDAQVIGRDDHDDQVDALQYRDKCANPDEPFSFTIPEGFERSTN